VAEALWAESVTVHEHGAPDAGPGTGVAVAIDTPRRRFGELRVRPDVARPFTADEIAFLDSVAHVLGEAIDRREKATEIAALAASRGRLVGQALDAEDRARRSMSERLHDGPLQDLLAAAHELYAASASPEASAAQERLRAIARELREVMAALHPTVLRYGGLRAALVAVAEQHSRAAGFAVDVAVDDEAAGLHDELLLSVARHLLSNAARHAAAERVTVTLGRTGAGLRLEVADDGRGLPAGALERGPDEGRLGLATSAERVAAVGGRLEARARPEGGTRVVVELPDRAAGAKS
jgi:two-component system NarL family sensor kinase